MASLGFSQVNDLLSVKAFRKFWLANIFSNLGTSAFVMAISWLTVKQYGAFGIASLALGYGIPQFCLQIIGGSVADRFARRRLYAITETGLLISAALLLFASVTGPVPLWLLVGVNAVNGAISSFDTPARSALITEMVSHDQIINAQQAYSISTSVTNIFGPALGGILLSLGKGGGSHEEIAFLFNVISFIPLLACIPSLPLTKFSKENKSKKTGIIQSALDGIKFVRKERDIRILLMLLAFVMLLGMPFQALLPVFVRTHLNPESGHVFYASLLSAVSLGGFCSSLIGFKEGTMSRPGLLLIIASLTLGLSILVLVSSGIIHWASLAAFFAGAGGTLVINYDNALIEKNTPMELQGRIASIASLTKGLQAFSVAAAGYLMHILSHAPSSTTSGYLEVQVSLAIVLLLSVCMMAPSLYRIRQTQASS